MRRPHFVVGLLGLAFGTALVWTAEAAEAVTVGSGYEVEGVTDLLGAAEHLDLDGVDELQRTGVWVTNFILEISDAGQSDCAGGYGTLIDPYGPYRVESAWSDGELAILDRVSNHYCVTREQAQVLGATVLTFLAGLDAGAKGGALARPPIPAMSGIVPVAIDGHGTEIVPVDAIPSDYRVVAVEHDGFNSFRIYGLDRTGEVLQVLADTVGPYSGQRLVAAPDQIDALQVQADGNWTATFLPVQAAAVLVDASSVSGVSDGVLRTWSLTDDSNRQIAFRHEGSGYHVFRAVGADGIEVSPAASAVGNGAIYVEVPASTRLIEVITDGVWRLETARDVRAAGALVVRQHPEAIVLEWIPPPASQGVEPTSYSVEYSSDGSTWVEDQLGDLEAGSTTVTLPGFLPGSGTTFRVTTIAGEEDRRPSESVMATSPCGATRGILAQLRSAIMGEVPGVADYEGGDDGRTPKAIAALLMAEARCVARFRDHDRTMMDQLGEELLSWPVQHPSDRFGWGLSFAWDAFGDDTVNPSNTVYSISTGLAVQALMDWADISGDGIRSRVHEAVARALDEWARPSALTAAGQLAYSLSGYDWGYDVFNSSAQLAGQMQRAAQQGIGEASLYGTVADTVMQSLADRHLEAPQTTEVTVRDGEDLDSIAERFGLEPALVRSHNGMSAVDEPEVGDWLLLPGTLDPGWYWTYSTTELIPNDLPHAGYVIEGIATYVEEGGALADLFPMERVIGHLEAFLPDETMEEDLLAWPVWRSPDLGVPAWRVPRLYGIGWTLALVADWPEELTQLRDTVCSEVLKYQRDGLEYLKYPRTLDLRGSENSEIWEYSSYLYLGLTTTPCDFALDGGTVNQSGDDYHLVPLTSLGEDAGAPADLWVDPRTGRSRLRLGEMVLDVPMPAVPVGVLERDGSVVALLREVPESTLALVRWDSGEPTTMVRLSGQDSAALLPRAIHRDGSHLYAVVYDNIARKNLLRRYGWEGLDLQREWVLPSLEPEAGHTYEMDPPVTFVAGNDGSLRIVGGSLYGTIEGDDVSYGRLVDCSTALEATAGPGAQLLVLCEADDYLPDAWYVRSGGFSLSVVEGGTHSSQRVVAAGTPFDLRFNRRLQSVEWLDSAYTGSAALLRHELQTGPNSGVHELGTNNLEGRVAWSQIYYLRALSDLIRAGSVWELNEEVAELVAPATQRLRIEMELLETVLGAKGIETLAFTVDRSPARFAVQTSRLASLYQHYLELFPASRSEFPALDRIVRDSTGLADHIEVVNQLGVDGWLPEGQAHLMWPEGSAFPFDGLNVPFNHQNEWAHATLGTRHAEIPVATRQIAEDVLGFFYDQILVPEGGVFPNVGVWPYWWGQAWEGWEVGDGISQNTTSYPGDRGNAWITFRTIDAEAMVEWSRYLDDGAAQTLLMDIAEMVRDGVVLPQVTSGLVEVGVLPELAASTYGRFGRVADPSRFPSVVWVHVLSD